MHAFIKKQHMQTSLLKDAQVNIGVPTIPHDEEPADHDNDPRAIWRHGC